MKKYNMLFAASLFALASSNAGAESYMIRGVPTIGNWSDVNSWILPTGKAPASLPTPADTVGTIDISRGINVDGKYTVKVLALSRFTSSLTGAIVPFEMKDGQSLTIDAAAAKAKSATVILGEFTTVKNDKAGTPLKTQGVVFKGGEVVLQNSGNPGGSIAIFTGAMADKRTDKDYVSRIIFESALNVRNTLDIGTKNEIFRKNFAYQNSSVDFAGKTFVGIESKGKKQYKDVRLPAVKSDCLERIFTVNIGSAAGKKTPFECGNYVMKGNAGTNVLGNMTVNGNFTMRDDTLNVAKGATLTVTSAERAEPVEFKNIPESVINIAGTLNILNPKYPHTSADFKGGIITIEDGGFLNVQGSGVDGKCFVAISGGSLNIKKGGRLYARNMLRIGDRGIVRLYGENQISAVEPAGKKARICIIGASASLELFSNQEFESFAFFRGNATLNLTIDKAVESVKLGSLVSGKWPDKTVIKIDGFRNGLIELGSAPEAAKLAAAVSSKNGDWANFRAEQKDGKYWLAADAAQAK